MRVLRPGAEAVTLVTPDARIPLEHEHRGVWVGALAGATVPDYSIDVEYGGTVIPGDDPYRFLPTLGDIDLHLFSEGRHQRLWEVFGAHVRTTSDRGRQRRLVRRVGTQRPGVRVAGDFNDWDGTAHPMRSSARPGSGAVRPEHRRGAIYKFESSVATERRA